MRPLYDLSDFQGLSDDDLLKRYSLLKERCETEHERTVADYHEVMDIVASEAIRRGLLDAVEDDESSPVGDDIPF